MSNQKNNKHTKMVAAKKGKVKIFTKKKSKSSIDDIISKLQNTQVDASQINAFKDLPLSPPTQKGLMECGFLEPTEIQKESLVHSLQGLDILGAAKTGSGKTLAFLIPVLELLFKKKWTRLDGLGALIITPVRELAYQIFETLKKFGRHHDFSAGLIIGGKDLHFERNRLEQINIIICTPGRLLQHMDENPQFNCDNMQILILDEADRCLDMGFEKSMNCIIENLPPERQTLLFSATQTKSVKDLARLSLKNPKYVSVHENARHSTPDGLVQSFVECELHDKIAMLWSFIKNHNKHKVLVFFATCKQVKYTHEIFTKLRPPIAILPLYGKMNQQRRMSIYDTFARKQHAVLFATDIASRGLDFPEVNWVVQLDCPEDANTYIHRAGRTARYHKDGESLLVLLPSEREAMLKQLEEKKIPINEIKINPSKLTNPQIKMEAFLAKDLQLKDSAQRAFKAYIKDVLFMKNKSVFKINALNTDLFARSLGLVVCPRVRAIKKGQTQEDSLKSEKQSHDSTSSSGGCTSDFSNKVIQRGKELYDFGGGDSDDSDLLVVKRRDHELAGCPDEDANVEVSNILEQMTKKSKKKPITKIALAKKILKKKIVANKKIVFSETGDSVEDEKKSKTTELGRQYDTAIEGGISIDEAKKVMMAEDEIDRKLFREKIRAKHREERLKAKELRRIKKRKDDDEAKAYSESESDEGPDLSWLPDPDKVYGDKTDSDSDLEDHDFPNRSENAVEKRKKKQNDSKPTKRLKELQSDEDDEPAGYSLKEDEDLVLQFLSKR